MKTAINTAWLRENGRSNATNLVLASAEIMQLVGKLTKKQYEELIRPMTIPLYVKSKNFSGLMLWEHSYLINFSKRMSLN